MGVGTGGCRYGWVGVISDVASRREGAVTEGSSPWALRRLRFIS